MCILDDDGISICFSVFAHPRGQKFANLAKELSKGNSYMELTLWKQITDS